MFGAIPNIAEHVAFLAHSLKTSRFHNHMKHATFTTAPWMRTTELDPRLMSSNFIIFTETASESSVTMTEEHFVKNIL